jgi:hypothetical protein
MGELNVGVGLDTRGSERAREIQLLVNVVAPDPRYQPWYLADGTTLFDIRDYTQSEQTIRQRLEGYFGRPLLFDAQLNLPLWQLVDEIKKLYPGWPGSCE